MICTEHSRNRSPTLRGAGCAAYARPIRWLRDTAAVDARDPDLAALALQPNLDALPRHLLDAGLALLLMMSCHMAMATPASFLAISRYMIV